MMAVMDLVDVTVVCLLIAAIFVCTESRQKCLTCQFQSSVEGFPHAKGRECIAAPYNWTGGEIRMRCPSKCIISAVYDEKALVPTFFYRGCSNTDRKDGCLKVGGKLDCFLSCGDGENYCNDQTSFKLIQEKLEEKEKGEGGDENNENDDMAASLYWLIGLIGACAVGYFVKKKYCTETEDEEEAAVS